MLFAEPGKILTLITCFSLNLVNLEHQQEPDDHTWHPGFVYLGNTIQENAFNA